MERTVLGLAFLDGLAVLWIDSRPGWDDTGITAGLLLLGSAFWSMLAPRRPWLIALLIGAWIPIQSILASRNFTALFVLAFTFVGAYAGAGIRRLASGLTPAK